MNQPNAPSVEVLRQHCKALCLPTTRQIISDALQTARREDWSLEAFLHFLLEQELAGRRQRRMERRIKESHLPAGKTLSVFDQKRLPLRVRRLLPQLRRGELLDRAENLLFFGLPGPPHAVHLLFNELVQPAILALQGAKLCRPQELKAHLEEDLFLPKRRMPRLKSGVLSFQGGQCRVRPVKSGEQSNCHIYCPASRRCLRTGERVNVHLPRTG